VSYHSYEGGKPRHLKVNAWAVAALFLGFLLTWAGISISARMGSVPDIAGSTMFDADPDTRIYMKDRTRWHWSCVAQSAV